MASKEQVEFNRVSELCKLVTEREPDPDHAYKECACYNKNSKLSGSRECKGSHHAYMHAELLLSSSQ